MTILIVSGTGTGVGKTVTTAALAAVATAGGRRVAVLKPAQTGVGPDEPGDVQEVERLAGPATVAELARYPEPLAPATAARRAGLPPVRIADAAATASRLEVSHDLVLVEGAGGLLVRYDDDGATLADLAAALAAPVLLVVDPELGTLNSTALTAEALDRRSLRCLGVVVGSWPAMPSLAARCNLADLPVAAGAPLVGVVPCAAAERSPDRFRDDAPGWLAPSLGGTWDASDFAAQWRT